MGEAIRRGHADQRAQMAEQKRLVTLTAHVPAQYVNGLIIVPMEGMLARFALIETTMPDIDPQVRFVGMCSPHRLKSLGEHFISIADQMIGEIERMNAPPAGKPNGLGESLDVLEAGEQTEAE